MIGMNTAIVGSRSGGNLGIGFAVPSNLARSIMESLRKTGRVERGYLGVNINQVTQEKAEAFKLPEVTGALVDQVNPGTAAAEAGLKAGDIILEFNGRKVSSPSALRLMVAQTPPKTKTSLKVWRDGKEKTLEVTLRELTKEIVDASRGGAAPSEEKTEEEAPVANLLPGVEIELVTEVIRKEINFPTELQGVIVVRVDGDSSANKPGREGLQRGDVIIEVDRKSVKSVKEALEAAKGAKGSLLLRVWNRGQSGGAGSTRFVVVPQK
jgi:serine protease Do